MHPLEGHIVKRFDGELGTLHLKVLEMGSLALNQVRYAMDAIDNRDAEKAHAVIFRESEVDEMEVRLDDEIASILARRTPVARDLRAVMSFSKAITDLERIADEAVKIAGLALQIYDKASPDPSVHMFRDIRIMGTQSVRLLDDSLRALDKLDLGMAETIAAGGTEQDEEFQDAMRRLVTFVMEDARNVGHSIRVMLIIKSLERISDHARNLAEYLIYLVRGEDVRHQQPNPTEQLPGDADQAEE